MEGIVKIIQSICKSDSEGFSLFLRSIEEHQSFRLDSNESSTVQLITNLLNKHTTRFQGLKILKIYLEQASLEVIAEKGQLWATLCIKTCNQKSVPAAVSLAYNCLEFLIAKSKDIPDLAKVFSSHLLAKICETLNFINADSHLASLKCVETIIRTFPGPSGTVRKVIEKFVVSFIDSSDENLVYWAGKCLHLLQQVKGQGNVGINYKSVWQQYHLKLVGSLHEVLDLLYSNFPEIYDGEIEVERLAIISLDLSSEPVKRSSQLLLRFKNLIMFLVLAIRDPFPVPKSIMPKKILNLISRCLSMNCGIAEKDPISDNLAVGALLPEIHSQVFKLLDVLILRLGAHLALYAKTILYLFADTLKWTSSKKVYGMRKPFCSLRISVYETFSLWCQTMMYGSLCEIISETLIEQINYDITPFYAEVTLKVLGGGKKHMTKKARRLLQKAENDRSNISQSHGKSFNPHNTKKLYSDEGNTNLCTAALRALRNLILSSVIFLKPTVVKDTQEKMFTLCAQLSEESSQKNKLYWSDVCREELYNVIYTLIISPHYFSPPSLELGVNLLEIGHHFDKSFMVRNSCNAHLKNIEKIIHPQKQCLYFPTDVSSMKTIFKKCEPKLVTDIDSDSSSNERENIENTVEDEEEFVERKTNQDATEKEDEDLSTENYNSSLFIEKDTQCYEKNEEPCEVEDNQLDCIPCDVELSPENDGIEEVDSIDKGTDFAPESKLDDSNKIRNDLNKNENENDGCIEDTNVTDEPKSKKICLEENILCDKVVEQENNTNMLDSILTTFVDELNEVSS